MGLGPRAEWPAILSAIVSGEEFTRADAKGVMDQIVSGNATDAQIGALLVGMRTKGESPTEMAGLVDGMLDAAVKISYPDTLLDTCGTGGDRRGTFNVSTCAALICAGAGARVAKHGNRAASSQCGSADVLEAMGVEIDLGPDGVLSCINEAGIGFLFARRYHPAMRHAAGPRTELGIPTVMNFLGPLSNPARATRYAMGVSRPEMAEKMAQALRILGAERAFVFHGHDGIDELSISGPSSVVELRDGEFSSYEVSPEDAGVARGELRELQGGDAATNWRTIRGVLEGKPGACAEIAILNAAAGIVAYGIADVLAEGAQIARESVESGRALNAAMKLIEVSRKAKMTEQAERN